MLKYLAILVIICFSTILCYSQDIHFSQFDATPLNMNPAFAGDFKGNYRIVGNHRTQWLSITENPYRTYSLSFDMNLNNYLSVPKSGFGAGLILNTDKAGDGDYGTTQIKLSPAYHRIITQDSSLSVSLGFNVAFNQNSIDYSAFYFGNQWDGNKYNSSIPHDEIFSKDQFSYFDISLGTQVKYIFNNGIPLNLGLSLNHLNKPKKSFYNDQITKLNSKFTATLQSKYNINDKSSLNPSIIYFDQGKYFELDIGMIFKHDMNDYNFKTIYYGGWIRARDAAIVKLGFDYKDFIVGISYDINLSKLRVASEGRGGIELSIIYIFNNKEVINLPYHNQCPVFM